ncbi:unnamed protein product [Auanema sp. JU1783]|nr:unnamed protein product [Auanema sp. JU1783]
MVHDRGRLQPVLRASARRSLASPATVGSPSSIIGSRKEVVINQLPLKDKDVVLDIMDTKKYEELKFDIKRVGGNIVDFISEDKPPFLVVSDHAIASKLEVKKLYDGVKIEPELLRKLPLMLKDAVRQRIRVRHVKSFTTCLARAKALVKSSRASLGLTNAPTKAPRPSLVDKPRLLQEPFIKYEDSTGMFSPSYKEFRAIPNNNFATIYLGKYFGLSLFHQSTAEQQERRQKELENKGAEECNSQPKPGYISKPRKKGGFCEICSKSSDNLRLHFSSKEHLAIVNQPGFYDEVDTLLGSYVEHITIPHTRTLKRKTTPLSVSVKHC